MGGTVKLMILCGVFFIQFPGTFMALTVLLPISRDCSTHFVNSLV